MFSKRINFLIYFDVVLGSSVLAAKKGNTAKLPLHGSGQYFVGSWWLVCAFWFQVHSEDQVPVASLWIFVNWAVIVLLHLY